ncbi:MAG: cobalamin B12-binding domain-containing protein [Planctomycetes bacterium]|nr:cobalamin B12-binding domain-containing protein [Planctomycetota bacterium]
MYVYLVYVGDDDYWRLLPAHLNRSAPDNGRIKALAFPPLGIQTLAPVLRQRGHQVRMFDTCHPGMKAQHIAEAAKLEKPGVIGLSSLSTTTYPTVKSLAARLKAELPGIRIILGGPFATTCADRILRDCRDIDCVGLGEGEELLPDYLANINAPGDVAGLVWRRGDEIIRNSPRPLIEDLDKYPYPDRESLPIDYIESLPLDMPAPMSLDKFCTMQTSRGCPHECVCCDIPLLSDRKWRCRSAEHVLGEMQQLHDMGYRAITLTDDQFLINRKRITAICDGIVQRKLALRWGCQGRVDSAAVDQFSAMKKAGCDMIAFGVESGVQKTLDRLHKRQTLEQVEHAVREAKRHGIRRIHGFFIIGCPDESPRDIRASFRFAARLQIDTFGFNRLCVYRGTPLWKEYVERGILDDDRDWHKWFKCSDIDPTVLPGAEVNRLRTKGYAMLFAQRILKRPIRTCRLLRSFSRGMGLGGLVGFLCTPFRRRKSSRKPELPAAMIEQGLDAPIRA